MRSVSLDDLASALSSYDAADLLASVAALQLMPENADRSIRLEAFAHVVASLPLATGKAHISLGRLRRVCNSAPLGEGSIASAEDPFDAPFTEILTFHDGPHTIFPGTGVESTFILRALSEAVFAHADDFRHPAFIGETRECVSAALLLSDEIARRAGLARGLEPVHVDDRGVCIPDSQRLGRLKRAVSFTESELEHLFVEQATSMAALQQLILPLGNVLLSDFGIGHGELLAHPIVKAGDALVVAIPGMLVAAARNELLRLAIAHEVQNTLAERYNVAVWDSVIQSLAYLDSRPLPIPVPGCLGFDFAREAVFTLDTDKVMYVVLVSDSLTAYDPQTPFSRWPIDGLQQKLEQRLNDVQQHLFSCVRSLNDILFLILVQGVGRWHVLGLFGADATTVPPVLIMTAADLQTISLLEGGDPLALWKYACASDSVRRDTRVMAMDQLDEFSIYRRSGHCYYLSDDGRPDGIFIAPGGAGELRREVLRQRDWHGVPSFERGCFVEVGALYDSGEVPIYVPPSLLGKRVALLVEGLPIPVWVIGPRYAEEKQRALHSFYANLAEAIGYWIWQFSPSLREALQSVTHCPGCMVISLELAPSEAWTRKPTEQIQPNEPSIDVRADPSLGMINLVLRPSLNALLQGADNAGERELMRHVLRAFRTLVKDTERSRLSEQSIAAILDKHAPIGIKKSISLLDTRHVPQLDPSGLPQYRKVQEADENQLLDELGSYLAEREHLRAGRIADEQRTAALNGVVQFYYEELVRLVASLRPEGLMEWLVAHHEAITRELSFHRLLIPTRLACFSSEERMVEQLRSEIPERSKAAMASRFLIEYVIAQPPKGLRPISLSVYDRLIALASQVINFGFESDLIHFQLAEIRLAVLPSGRLGLHREEYEKAREAYMPIFARAELAQAVSSFARHWPDGKAITDHPELSPEIDSAVSAEFGYSLTELLSLLAEALAVGSGVNPSAARLPLHELSAILADRLGWSLAKVSEALGLFSLGPRAHFLRPGQHYRKEDVYPWRFNRPLSYLRRPFLKRESSEGVEVVWGFRHIYGVGSYLVDLVLDGRLRARSPEMRRLQGVLNRQRGEAFTDQVAQLLETDPTLIVRRRVKKIGELRGKGGPPGDIDVLVANPRTRTLTVVECKCLASARTPHELANELGNLFRGQHGRTSIAKRHQERVKWVKNRIREILAWLGLHTTGRWRVKGLLVLDHEPFTLHLWQSPIAVVSFANLTRTGS